MRTKTRILFVATLLASAGWIAAASDTQPTMTAAELRESAKEAIGVIPDKMPGSENDTPAKVKLGEKLYSDTILSENKTQSCNTCHRLDENRGGVDNHTTSEGAFNKFGDRNSPTVLNAGFQFAQFWDGRAADLVEQAKGPVLNPIEMAMPSEDVAVKRLKADADYPKMFKKAFPKDADPISYHNMALAIAAFERTLITKDRFDDFQKGKDKALSPLELKGLENFLMFGCTTCHNGPVMGGNSYQKSGLVNPYEFAEDLGRSKVTNTDDDKFKFKVPMLRNVALTYPYFHDGKVKALPEVVQRMGWMQLGLKLEKDQIDSLVAFLNTLSDKKRAQD